MYISVWIYIYISICIVRVWKCIVIPVDIQEMKFRNNEKVSVTSKTFSVVLISSSTVRRFYLEIYNDWIFYIEKVLHVTSQFKTNLKGRKTWNTSHFLLCQTRIFSLCHNIKSNKEMVIPGSCISKCYQ